MPLRGTGYYIEFGLIFNSGVAEGGSLLTRREPFKKPGTEP